MAWKATGNPTVRQQRGRWVVRVDGLDTATGKPRPRQLGTYPSRRAAQQAAATSIADGEPAVADRASLAWLVDRWVVSRNDVGLKAREQHAWAAKHIKEGLGGLRIDALDRDDVARWLDGLATGGRLARRSVQLCRTILRAVLADAVEEGLIRRSPAARVGMPRQVVKPDRQREVDAWDEAQVATFLDATASYRWAGLGRSGSPCSTGCAAASYSVSSGTTWTSARERFGSMKRSSRSKVGWRGHPARPSDHFERSPSIARPDECSKRIGGARSPSDCSWAPVG